MFFSFLVDDLVTIMPSYKGLGLMLLDYELGVIGMGDLTKALGLEFDSQFLASLSPPPPMFIY